MFHLNPKPRPPEVGGPGDARPRRGLLGDGDDARHLAVDGRVHLLQERHGLEVLPAAVHVRRPLAVLAGVVEVEHRGDRVDADAVDVELLAPEQRVGDEEVAHLGPAEVEDVGAPVRLLAAARVGVLVQRRAVEPGQRPLVLGEVRRDPVDDDADAGLVGPVDEVAEVVGAAEAGRRRVVAGDLVAPGPAEGVLGDRHALDVGEAGGRDVVDQLVGQLPVGQPLPPGAEVHLVDAHRPLVPVAGRPVGEPRLVRPLVGGLGDDRGVERRHLGGERQGVGLLPPRPVGTQHVVAVPGAGLHAGDVDLPDAGGAQRPHRVRARLPVVEVAGHLHPAGVGRPHGERDALDGAPRGVVAADVRAEHLPQLLVPALADEVLVELADGGQPAVGVVDGEGVGAPGAVAVGRPRSGSRPGCFGSTRLVDAAAVQLARLVAAAVLVSDGDGDGLGPQRPDRPPVRRPVGAEHGVRVVRPALHDRAEVVPADVGGGGVACAGRGRPDGETGLGDGRGRHHRRRGAALLGDDVGLRPGDRRGGRLLARRALGRRLPRRRGAGDRGVLRGDRVGVGSGLHLGHGTLCGHRLLGRLPGGLLRRGAVAARGCLLRGSLLRRRALAGRRGVDDRLGLGGPGLLGHRVDRLLELLAGGRGCRGSRGWGGLRGRSSRRRPLRGVGCRAAGQPGRRQPAAASRASDCSGIISQWGRLRAS